MVNVSKWAPDRYFKPDDVRTAPVIEKIAVFKPPGDQDRWPKPRLIFESGMIARLNKISMRALTDEFGPESDAWIGQEVTVGCESTTVAGGAIDVIVVRPIEGDSSVAAGVERRARYKAKAAAPPPAMDDSIEF
jgi:hypothetical protein